MTPTEQMEEARIKLGLSSYQAAQYLGISAQLYSMMTTNRKVVKAAYVIALRAAAGLAFEPPPEPVPHGNSMAGDVVDRDADILARHELGEPHPSIASFYKITRERVRQIVREHGLAPRSDAIAERHKCIAETVQSENLTYKEAAARFSVDKATILNICRAHGVKPKPDNYGATADYQARKARVLAGESYYSAADQNISLSHVLRNHMRAEGLSSSHQSRNPRYRKAKQEGTAS